MYVNGWLLLNDFIGIQMIQKSLNQAALKCQHNRIELAACRAYGLQDVLCITSLP